MTKGKEFAAKTRRLNYESMAILHQRLMYESASNAQYWLRQRNYKMAAFYQRQSRRDYIVMWSYLSRAISE